MTSLPDALPIILVLAVLVGAFVSLERRAPSTRLRLWTYAWALCFVHFIANAIPIEAGVTGKILNGFDLGALELSGVVFLSSTMLGAGSRRKQAIFVTLIGAPLVAHAFVGRFGWGGSAAVDGLMAAAFLSAIVFSLFTLNSGVPLRAGVAIALAGIGAFAIHEQRLSGGDPWFAGTFPLMLTYGLSGVFYWRLYRRRSLGVMLASGGFLGWGAVYPIGLIMTVYSTKLQVRLDLWNVPRILVALGMVLTLLEENSTAIESAHTRTQAENLLLQRLSQITSRLLGGHDPATLCGEAASAITEASSYRCAALFLLGEDRRFYLAGLSGFTAQEAEILQSYSSSYAIESLKSRSARGPRPSNQSFRMTEERDLTLIPMVSWRGAHVGCLYVSDSRDAREDGSSEMVKLELFASDLAVTFENLRLHQQIVRSEKLAGLGQLVAGVAHELNNPLTGIIGYADLLGDEVHDEKLSKRVEKLGHEARRMKRIVDGLLRFGRQSDQAIRSTGLEAVLRDVIQLREYHLRKLSIVLDVQLEPALPPIGIGEDELKQVLLNILNNAIDAVAESARKEIHIRSSSQAGRAVIQCEDSGPGFTDPSRAFDPFYTTKPVGKGTGLGLSICYGIVQECKGEITIANQQPYGASVVVELPLAIAAPAIIADDTGAVRR
ncbi:MAG TPA: ATP-binding protein [Candidatus Acidoferrales bacterium]|nr:ATP-binding protein [Candidatus Acidoferrales bacterium]